MSALDFAAAALQLGVTEASIRAVDTVESAGGGFWGPKPPPPNKKNAGKIKMLFEPHKFRAHTKCKYDLSHPALSHKYELLRNKASYKQDQHAVFESAAALDREAAIKSCSWGRYQLLGEHCKALGFDSAEEFLEQNLMSEHQQLMIFCKFVRINPAMHLALKSNDWARFAYHYNGPNYRVNSYDQKLADAYKKWGGK